VAPRISKIWLLQLESNSALKWSPSLAINVSKFKSGTLPVNNNIEPSPQRMNIIKRHYRKAQGALVVYDITKEVTFRNVKKWIEGIR
jgi:GTPase SAR1 family protein